MTTFEQAWRDAYGSPEAWERERHGTAEQAERCNRALPTWVTPEWLRAAADYIAAAGRSTVTVDNVVVDAP